MNANEVFALRKQGRSREALELARAGYSDNGQDIWFLRAYAWALYDQAKELISSFDAKQLSANGLGNQLTPLMREFAKIAEPLRGDTAFSQLLRLALKVSKDWSEFLKFARWAGVDDFSEEDKAPFVNQDGKTVDSLQRRFIRAICRETVAKVAEKSGDQELVEWGLTILEKAVGDEPNDQWLNYYQSKLHLANGDDGQAIKHLVPVLNRQSRAAWPWALLGEILELTRPEDAITCFTHAVRLAREEQEVAKTRIRLARRLSLACRYSEAADQAASALRYREHQGIRIPQELTELLASDWYQAAIAGEHLQKLPDATSAARQLLKELSRQDLSYTQGVIDHVNLERSLSYVATGPSTGFALKHDRFPDLAALMPGTVVEVGHAGAEGPPLDWRPSKLESLPGLCQWQSGRLERHHGKDFAFIRTGHEDIFVPPDQAATFEAGQEYTVSCLAIRRVGKNGKTGWRSVRLAEDHSLEVSC